MKPILPLLLLFCMTAVPAFAQDQSATLNVGDTAPPLRVREWLKGTPLQSFEKGKVYVVDFWASWCRPCNAAMPYLSALAREYKGKAIFLVIDVWEKGLEYHPQNSTEQVTAFVDSMGDEMDLPVAADDSDFMANHWLRASDWNSVPTDFVVDAQGRVAWIGNPVGLDTVLPKVVDHNWNIKAAIAKHFADARLAKLDNEADKKLRKYLGNYDSLGYHLVKPDSVLFY